MKKYLQISNDSTDRSSARKGRRLRVAFLIDTIVSDAAGTERQLLQIIARLDRSAFQPFLISLWDSPWLHGHAVPAQLHTLSYRGLLRPTFPSVLFRLRGILRANRVDVIHSFFEDSLLVGWLCHTLLWRRPVLIGSRRDIGLNFKERRWYDPIYAALRRVAQRRCSGLIVNALHIKEKLLEEDGIPGDKVVIVPNGIELPASTTAKPDVFTQCQADVWIAIVANLHPVKRVDIFIRAMAFLREAIGPLKVRALVFGDGYDRQKLVRLRDDLGLRTSVEFMGSVPSVFPYLQHMDIGALTSDREGFSNAILEYMACGLPIVATNIGGNREAVDNTNGILVPPGDHVAFGSALLALAKNRQRRRALGQRSLEQVREAFSWAKTMQILEAYYRRAVLAEKDN